MRYRAVEKVLLEEKSGVLGKVCTRCNVWKPLDGSYGVHKTCVGNRDSVCKQCRANYRKKNSEAIKKSNKEYKTKNKETVLQKDREYRENNISMIRAKQHAKRASDLGLESDITPEDIDFILAEFRGECPITGSNEIDFDHFIPITKGGETSRRNLVPLKKGLNISKSNNNPFEWAQRKLKGIEIISFNHVVAYLANLNDMSAEEYKRHVDSHFKEVE